MASSGSPPPPQARPAGMGADVSVFLDTDLGTHLALSVFPYSSIRRLKSQVATEHAALFPDLGPVTVKSFQVLRKGAMYHLSDSMTVRSAFAKVSAGCFLHVMMADTHCCRDEDRGISSEDYLRFNVDTHVRELPETIPDTESGVLPQGLEGAEGALVVYNVHAHDALPNDVHLPSSSQQNAEQKKNEAVSLDSDVWTISVSAIDKPKSYKRMGRHGVQTGGSYVSSTSVANINVSTDQRNMSLAGEEIGTRKEDHQHSFRDNDLGVLSHNKEVGMEQKTQGEVHSFDDLDQEKEGKKARKTGYFDTLTVNPAKESNNPETTVVNQLDRVPLESKSYSHGLVSSTSFQQVHGNEQQDSVQLENPIIAGNNRKREEHQLLTSESVSAQEMAKRLSGAIAAPKTIRESTLHEDNLGLQGDGTYHVEMTSREKTMVKPSDLLLSSSQLNIGSLGTKNVQLVSDAQTTSDLVSDQGGIGLVHEWYRNLTVGDTSNSTSKVIASDDISSEDINDGYQGEGAAEASNMEKGSKGNNVLEKIYTVGNSSQEKNCEEAKKVCDVGITSMDTAEEKDHGRYSKKAAYSDIISTHGETINDIYKQQGDCNAIEDPIVDGNRKKRRRRLKSSNGNPAQNASSTQNNNAQAQPLDATKTTLDTVGGETGEEKDHCMYGEKVVKPVKVSTQGEIVKNLSNVQQRSSVAIENSNDNRKRKKKRGRQSESSKHDPTQDVKKSSGCITNECSIQNTIIDPLNAKKQITPGTIGEATVNDCKKLDENLAAAITNVSNVVLADLKCRDSISNGLNGDPLTEPTHVGSSQNELGIPEYPRDKDGVNPSISPKYPAEIRFDAPISSPSHKKYNGIQLKLLPTVLDSCHPSGGVLEENANNTELRESDSLRCYDSDLKDVFNEHTVPADDNIKPTKRQRKKTSLKHVSTDSRKAIQYSVEQVNQVAPEDLEGANDTRAELVQGDSAIDAPAITVKNIRKKSKRSSRTQAPNTREINQSQFAKDKHENYVLDADLMNSSSQQMTAILNSSTADVEPNDHPDKDEVILLDHFGPSGTDGLADYAENNKDETIREVKGKKKSKRKTMLSQHDSSTKPDDPLESHLHTNNTSLTDQLDPGNVGVPSDLLETTNREDGILKKAKEKKNSKKKTDLVKPESQNHSDAHHGAENRTLFYPVVQKERNEQDNGKRNNVEDTQNSSMLQQKIEHAACDSTPEKKAHQSMFDASIHSILTNNKDHAHMSIEQKNSTSQTKHHVKSGTHDESISGRTCPNLDAVSNLVYSFSISPSASSQCAEDISQNFERYRVAVRKVPRERHDQVSEKSKKDIKRGTSAIFTDDTSESSDDVLNTVSKKAVIEASANDSTTSADSANGSDVPDDDDIVSLSRRSLRAGVDIGSILRSSSSYKKARLKKFEQLDDTDVPDSLQA